MAATSALSFQSAELSHSCLVSPHTALAPPFPRRPRCPLSHFYNLFSDLCSSLHPLQIICWFPAWHIRNIMEIQADETYCPPGLSQSIKQHAISVFTDFPFARQ